MTKGIDLGRYVLNIVNIDPLRSLAPMTTPSDPELQAAKEQLLSDVCTKILQQISDGTVKGTASDRVELNWAEAREVLRALSSLDALEVENARVMALIVGGHPALVSRAEAAEAQRDKLIGEVERLKNNLLDAEQAREDHLQHVSEFLSELYAVMVDPCATETIKVEVMTKELLAAATLHRENFQAAEARLSALEGALERIEQGDDAAFMRAIAKTALRAALNPTLPTGEEGKAVDPTWRQEPAALSKDEGEAR